MVAAARLQWIAEQVSKGRGARVAFSYNETTCREKVKFVLAPPAVSQMQAGRRALLCALSAIDDMLPHMIVTDKGHLHSDGGCSVEFWFAAPPAVRFPPVFGGHGQAPGEGGGPAASADEDYALAEPDCKRLRTATEASFASIEDEQYENITDLAHASECVSVSVAAAQAPLVGTEPSSEAQYVAGRQQEAQVDEAIGAAQAHVNEESHFFAAADLATQVRFIQRACVIASKNARGRMHPVYRQALRHGLEPGVDIDEEYRATYFESVCDALDMRRAYPHGIPSEIREAIEHFVAKDIRFMRSDPPEVVVAAPPSEAVSPPSGARIQETPPSDTRASGALRSPGFGKGPRRTRKGR
uniref:Uncharacterized protein n=1 Tax=Zooxanthella nutricula TaxID=1333877 RepID=A0A7S2PMA7_9DINO